MINLALGKITGLGRIIFTVMRWHTAGRAQNKQNKGGCRCRDARRLRDGSKQESGVEEVAPKCAGRM